MKRSQGVLLALCLTLGYAAAAQTCYFPNGDEASDDVPCSSDEHTNCCGSGGICMSNGYCLNALSQPYTLSRGTCTDQSWGSNCTQRCIGTDDNPSGGVSVVNLDYIDGEATYCCGTPVSDGSSVICPNGEDSFTIETGSMLVGRAALANLTESNSDSDSSTASASATATAISASGTSQATASGSSSQETASTTATCDSSKGTSATAVGAGVGVPLGVIALSAIAWALWERGKRRKGQQPVMPPQELGTTPAEQQKVPYNYGQANYGQPTWQNQQLAELPNAGYPSEMDSHHVR